MNSLIFLAVLCFFILFLTFENNNQSLDFLTLVYNDKIEIELLKLQAMSFKFIDAKLIGKIYIFYNDEGINKIEFIKEYYPKLLHSKIKIIYRDNISDRKEKSSWHSQQYWKLYISKFIDSEYYIILDGKNHFIRETKLEDFFKNNKPILYSGDPGEMIKYYHSCLSYFKIQDPFNGKIKLLTTTPFILIKNQVIKLIKYIENKENMDFYDFFMKNQNNITEFYLYNTYLIYSFNINRHELIKTKKEINITIFHDPREKGNKYENKKQAITNKNVKIFGLHKAAVEKMDKTYKENLLFLYSHFYDKNICSFIKKHILYRNK